MTPSEGAERRTTRDLMQAIGWAFADVRAGRSLFDMPRNYRQSPIDGSPDWDEGAEPMRAEQGQREAVDAVMGHIFDFLAQGDYDQISTDDLAANIEQAIIAYGAREREAVATTIRDLLRDGGTSAALHVVETMLLPELREVLREEE